MRARILGILQEGGSAYISGEKISEILGVSRSAVWKHIENLREEGYEIDSATKKGYKLISVPDILFPQEISPGLDTKRLGKSLRHFHVLDSTNEYARVLAEEGAKEGTVVIAEQQKKGRGRMDRPWFSPRGGIWFSVIFRPPFRPHRAPGITLVSTAAVTNALSIITGLEPLIKWPNDIYIEGRKVGGILTEMRAEMDRIHYIIQGIGINAN
ncbi:MAG: biotin--[acetyl-CoA-carboxylase] ligase, partial [Clostridia bacterium]|nr:biotin--[acetyl-CoA-carboxylase] ligase [Clostridia bacterium]